MYANNFGRFTAVDPLLASGESGDPQTFNRYLYVNNSVLVYKDPTGLVKRPVDIIIIENGKTGGNAQDSSDSTKNPIGHTAIAITGKGVFSMGNADKEPERDQKNNILGGNLKDYLEREAPRRDTVVTIIKTTPEQDEAMAAKLMEIANSNGTITRESILSDNCSTRVNKALDAGGIPSRQVESPDPTQGVPNPVIPGSAGQRAQMVPGAQVFKIAKGSELTKELTEAIKQFERQETNKQTDQR